MAASLKVIYPVTWFTTLSYKICLYHYILSTPLFWLPKPPHKLQIQNSMNAVRLSSVSTLYWECTHTHPLDYLLIFLIILFRDGILCITLHVCFLYRILFYSSCPKLFLISFSLALPTPLLISTPFLPILFFCIISFNLSRQWWILSFKHLNNLY